MVSSSVGSSELLDSTMLVSSSSTTVTGRSFLTSPYSPPFAVCVSVASSLTASSSWAAVTVTVRAVFQLEELKVRVSVSLRPDRVRSVLS